MNRHYVTTKRSNTREFVELCRNYLAFVTVRKLDSARDVIVVNCSLWTWLKIRFMQWIKNPDLFVETAEELQ